MTGDSDARGNESGKFYSASAEKNTFSHSGTFNTSGLQEEAALLVQGRRSIMTEILQKDTDSFVSHLQQRNAGFLLHDNGASSNWKHNV